jgi:hypothetical protein
MIPQPAETAALTAPAARQHSTHAYQQILAYYRGELSDPQACAAVEDQLRRDPRWQAHADSIRHLDLERAAAVQDAADLACFSAEHALHYCRAVAESGGRVFDEMLHESSDASSLQRQAWNRHTMRCVYCRRMKRLAHARQQQREAGLPVDEPLLRDWLLQPCYLEALHDATRRLGFELKPDTTDSGDTVLHLDTILQDPPSPPPTHS